ncbi:MAG: methyltransferase domain-containing protein, partial [Gemmatimonadota bacterium]
AVMACMVLHHISRPERVLVEAHRVLEPGGILVVVDLLQHEDESLRERLADLWLGFRPADLKRWIRAAGFEVVSSAAIVPEAVGADRTTRLKDGPPGGGPQPLTLITFRGRKAWQRKARPPQAAAAPRRAAAKTTR